MKTRTVLLTLVFLGAVFSTLGGAEPAEYLAITRGTIIDGTGKPPVPGGTVLIKGDRIEAVGKAAEIKIPPEAEVINAAGKTILPGIIDSHVHKTWDPGLRRKFIPFGITSVCDLGAPVTHMAEYSISLHGKEIAARGFKAGPIITVPNALPDAFVHENMNYEISTPEEGRKGVVDLLGKKADVVKIYLHPVVGTNTYPTLSAEQVRAIVEEAHKRGALVRVHCSQLEVLDFALDGGVDSVEHVPIPVLTSPELGKKLEESKDPLKDLYDYIVNPKYDEVLPRMIKQGIVLVPTLERSIGRFYQSSTATPGQKVVAQATLDIVKRFHKLGGKIAMGTDLYKNNHRIGELHLREMELLQAAGLTPMEIIKASTETAAFVSGHGKELGSLEKGKLADLVLVDGDPLKDLKILGKVETVLLGGKVAFIKSE